MTAFEERMAKIERKAKAVEDAKIEQKKEIHRKAEDLISKWVAYGEDIENLIEIANHCRKYGIEIPDRNPNIHGSYSCRVAADHGWGNGSYGFFADGFYHHLGFVNPRNGERIKELCIRAGGACGPWDFYTNGYEFWLKHEKTGEINSSDERIIRPLKDFLGEIEQFKKAFYHWVDSLA